MRRRIQPLGWQSGSGQSKQLSATKHPSGTLKLNNACLVSLAAPSGTDTVIPIVSPTPFPDACRCGNIPNTPVAPDSTIPPPGVRESTCGDKPATKRRHAGRISRKWSCMMLPILVAFSTSSIALATNHVCGQDCFAQTLPTRAFLTRSRMWSTCSTMSSCHCSRRYSIA